jgi:YfiH family protein
VTTEIQVIVPDWPVLPRVRAAFTLRDGGVSLAPFDSLNLGAGIGDSPAAVAENRRRVGERLGLPAEPRWLEQVHGVDVVEVGASRSPGAATVSRAPAVSRTDSVATMLESAPTSGTATTPKADASVTHVPGGVCAIRVADCMPVLFAALDGAAVGASHAGWRGLAGGVLEATVERLGIPPSHLVAWMGPAIGPRHFEVGDDVRTAFVATDENSASAFEQNERGRWQCDLYALARRRLMSLGVAGVYGGGWCTFAQPDRFFSYRRDRHCGRMAALIWIEAGRT